MLLRALAFKMLVYSTWEVVAGTFKLSLNKLLAPWLAWLIYFKINSNYSKLESHQSLAKLSFLVLCESKLLFKHSDNQDINHFVYISDLMHILFHPLSIRQMNIVKVLHTKTFQFWKLEGERGCRFMLWTCVLKLRRKRHEKILYRLC